MGRAVLIFAILLTAKIVFAKEYSTATPVKQFNEYKELSCVVSTESGEVLKNFDERFIVVKMDDHPGLFRQMRLESGLDQIQLQVLLEEGFDKKADGAINVLVNFSVSGKEISSEFAAQNVKYLSIKNQTYKARCDLK